MGLIRWNHQTYYQDGNGYTMQIMSLIEDVDGDPDYIVPPSMRAYNEQATRRLPDALNTTDPATTCKWCNTTYRASDQHDPDRCPYCWRLV